MKRERNAPHWAVADGSDDFRRPALMVLLLFGVAFLVWHTALEFRFGVRLLAGIELALGIHFAVLAYRVWRRPYSTRLALSFLVPLLTVVLVAMAHVDTPPNVFIWVFLMPVLSYSLLGRRLGFAVALTGTLLALLAYLHKYADVPEHLHALALSDSLICLFSIWVAMHLYERNHERTTAELQRLATTDALTGLQNRRHLEKVVTHLAAAADRQKQSLGVVVLDLDHFKRINDRWGHHAGDAVLTHVAGVVRDRLRESDWAFRIGGEEFCLVLTVAGREGAAAAAESLRRQIAERPCEVQGETIPLSASIGLALHPQDASTFEQLLSQADARMYRAKQRGRNRVVSDDAPEDAADSPRAAEIDSGKQAAAV
jgi:diguanylate cyclase (GGDEF)-like protein